jgi:hypothetical protein
MALRTAIPHTWAASPALATSEILPTRFQPRWRWMHESLTNSRTASFSLFYANHFITDLSYTFPATQPTIKSQKRVLSRESRLGHCSSPSLVPNHDDQYEYVESLSITFLHRPSPNLSTVSQQWIIFPALRSEFMTVFGELLNIISSWLLQPIGKAFLKFLYFQRGHSAQIGET